MRIVALDSYMADFDGLPWFPVEALGEFSKYPFSTPEEAADRARNAHAILVNKVLVDARLLDALPSLQYVGVTATGVNNIRFEEISDRGLAVTNVPGYSTDSVSQLVFAYILDHFCRLPVNGSGDVVREWSSGPYVSLQKEAMFELRGKTLAILGFGEIGQRVAEIARAFGMEILVTALPGRDYADARMPLEEAFSAADVVSVHCPLTPETEGIIGEKLLKRMKASAILINTSRGSVVDISALKESLETCQIAHAYLDVLPQEPPSPSESLLTTPRLTLTPHIAWGAREARERLVKEAADNLAAFQKGIRRNRVD